MKIICVGRNYVDHAKELGNDIPDEPVIFMKPKSALLQTHTPFYYPEFSNELHYEVELVLRICKNGRYIPERQANKYYNALTVGIDFTARDIQNELKAKGLPWEKSKAFDGSAVIGDFLPKSQFNSLENIIFELTNNNKIVQKGNTNEMLWKIDEIISYVSQFFTLKIGDIIFTGSPEGVAAVKPEDVLEGFLEGNKLFSIQIK